MLIDAGRLLEVRKRPAWLAALLVIGTLLAYLPVWRAGLIWDDRSLVVDNRSFEARAVCGGSGSVRSRWITTR
jgi:hypothetical protein